VGRVRETIFEKMSAGARGASVHQEKSLAT